MAAASDVRKAFNIFVNGKGYAGQAEDFNAPKLTLTLEKFRAGGMNTAVSLNMGMEEMEADFSLVQYSADVLALFGVAAGSTVPIIARESLESYDGTTTGVVHTMYGTIKEMDPGTSTSGQKTSLKVSLMLSYYKLQHGDRVVQEIDAVNMIHIVDGTDVLAAQRAALGM